MVMQQKQADFWVHPLLSAQEMDLVDKDFPAYVQRKLVRLMIVQTLIDKEVDAIGNGNWLLNLYVFLELYSKLKRIIWS